MAGRCGLKCHGNCRSRGDLFFLLQELQARLFARRELRKVPQAERQVSFRFDCDHVEIVMPVIGRRVLVWTAMGKPMRTAEGLVIYPDDELCHWLPNEGFRALADIERTWQLIEAKAPDNVVL